MSRAVAGCIDNVQNAMMIGALGCCKGQMGFFQGCIDDVSIDVNKNWCNENNYEVKYLLL